MERRLSHQASRDDDAKEMMAQLNPSSPAPTEPACDWPTAQGFFVPSPNPLHSVPDAATKPQSFKAWIGKSQTELSSLSTARGVLRSTCKTIGDGWSQGDEIPNFGRKEARTAVSHRGRISVLARHWIMVRGRNEPRGRRLIGGAEQVMGSEILRAEHETAPALSAEVEFALVLSRMIDSVKSDPEHLRATVYELARHKLKEQFGSDKNTDMRQLSKSLEVAIRGVETFVSKNDGTHYFSSSLQEHNRAVHKYQKRKAGKTLVRQSS